MSKHKPSEILLYATDAGEVRMEVFFEDETFWLSQKKIAELFDKDVRTVNEHLNRIFDEGELDKEAVIRNFRITASDGKSYTTQHYNLAAIIAVGYRANSHRATQFRIWATKTLKEFIIKVLHRAIRFIKFLVDEVEETVAIVTIFDDDHKVGPALSA